MKSAIFPNEVDELQELEIKGWIQLPENRKSFSVGMIVFLLNKQCPLQSVSKRTVQRAIADLRHIGVQIDSIMCGNTPYYDVFATKVILVHLKFKTK